MRISKSIYEDARAKGETLKTNHRSRIAFQRQCEDIYLMKWNKAPKEVERVTVSPDARNALLGAYRLLIAAAPVFNVDFASGTSVEKTNSELIEKACARIFEESSRVNRKPLHQDVVLSALLYGQVHQGITLTSDLVASAEKSGRGLERAKRLAAMTPVLFESWNPMDGYYEFDQVGLSCYLRESMMTVADVLSRWGNNAADLRDKYELTDRVNYAYYWDAENAVCWAADVPIMTKKHNLPIIPITVQTVDGSKLFAGEEDQVQPFYYTLAKSGLWDRVNVAMTVLYFLIESEGLSPMYIHMLPPGINEKELDVDFSSVAGGVVHVAQGETYSPILNKGLLDPAVREAIMMAEQKSTESTIYRQALGEPIQGTGTFSSLALLSQSGRLPLIGPQTLGGYALANSMEIAMELMRVGRASYEHGDVSLMPDDIPEGLRLSCKLEAKLPQDKLQLANIANLLTGGQNPLTSRRWAREEILGIGQSNTMDKEVWTEQATAIRYGMYVQQMIEAEKQRQAMEQQAQQQQMQPQQGQAPQQQGPSPEEMQAMMQQQQMQQPGQGEQMTAMPMMAPGQGQQIQGMPPEQAGLMPGGGFAAVPPEEKIPGRGLGIGGV